MVYWWQSSDEIQLREDLRLVARYKRVLLLSSDINIGNKARASGVDPVLPADLPTSRQVSGSLCKSFNNASADSARQTGFVRTPPPVAPR